MPNRTLHDRGDGERSEPGSLEPVFFGAIEVAHFIYLFISPYFSSTVVLQAWCCLALWRVGALAVLMYQATGSAAQKLRSNMTLVGKSVAYSVPFLISSLFFTLRVGQREAVGNVYLLGLALLLLCVGLGTLRTFWLPALMGCLTFSWFQQGQGDGWQYWPCLLAVVVVFLPRHRGSEFIITIDRLRSYALLVCLGWSSFLFLDSLAGDMSLAALSRALTLWCLLVASSVFILTIARDEQMERPWLKEVELSLPSLEDALRWKHGRRLWSVWLPWFCLAPLAIWDEGLWLVFVGFILAIVGLVILAGKRTLSGTTLQNWCCWQFVLLWGVAESTGNWAWAWLAVSALTSLYCVYAGRGVRDFSDSRLSLVDRQAELEKMVAGSLKIQAPPGLLADIMIRSEPSVELDESLSAKAPQGFRERLLERLKNDVTD